MKSHATLSAIGALILGAAAQTNEIMRDTCPTTFSYDCPYICTHIRGTSCSKTNWFSSNASGCSLCPGIPSTCPANWIENCAYVCEYNGFESDPWCSPDDLTASGRAKCSACSGKPPITATPAPTVISGIPQPSTSSRLGDVLVVCAQGFNPECQFVCDIKQEKKIDRRTGCFKQWSLDENISNCAICPGVPYECPAVSTPSCAFLCKASFQDQPFCNVVDLTGYPRSGGTLSCKPCGGGKDTNSTATTLAPTAESTTTAVISTTGAGGNYTGSPTDQLPAPTYSSQASLIGISTSALLGLLSVIFAM
ncbi:hypothetical protein TWF506_004520 [Arthrobotrys conoides]|uniref:Uncharacterized protein n=1 Tax=Arthrobotrys conoides TaxID=74498 RepID=A0AAN8RTL2_9PEZI